MPRGRPMEPLVLTDDEESQLLSVANSRSLPHGLVQRARIVLACAQGEANTSIARRMRLSNATFGKWRKRYRMQGIEGLHDELRPGRPRTHDDERVAEIINAALQTKPPDGSTHWSVRTMAGQTGVSKSTVQRWFSLFAVQPTASVTSNSPTTPSSSKRCATSSASISTRPTTPSSCVSTRRPKSRRSIVPNRCCRWGWATSKGSPTITSVTAPPPCSPPSTSPPAGSSPSARSAIATRSSLPSCVTSTPTSPKRSTSTLSPTTTPPTSTPRSEPGSQGARDTTSTTHPPTPRGSTRSSAGSASSPKWPSDAARSPTSGNS